jgi:hypothetical protein
MSWRRQRFAGIFWVNSFLVRISVRIVVVSRKILLVSTCVFHLCSMAEIQQYVIGSDLNFTCEKNGFNLTRLFLCIPGEYYFPASKTSRIFGETYESKRQRISWMALRFWSSSRWNYEVTTSECEIQYQFSVVSFIAGKNEEIQPVGWFSNICSNLLNPPLLIKFQYSLSDTLWYHIRQLVFRIFDFRSRANSVRLKPG